MNPGGRAQFRACEHVPPREQPDDDHPLRLTTGRTIHHFHTRTETGRAPELQAAAPEVWVEVSAADARRLGLAEGDRARVSSPRGTRGEGRADGDLVQVASDCHAQTLRGLKWTVTRIKTPPRRSSQVDDASAADV